MAAQEYYDSFAEETPNEATHYPPIPPPQYQPLAQAPNQIPNPVGQYSPDHKPAFPPPQDHNQQGLPFLIQKKLFPLNQLRILFC